MITGSSKADYYVDEFVSKQVEIKETQVFAEFPPANIRCVALIH